jgi:hypothetical protein
VAAFEIFSPKYLKFSTVLIYSVPTYIYYLQFINMAFVLSILMSRSFDLQKRAKQFNNNYSSWGEGAIRTKSSAKASMNNYNDAIV